MVVVLRTTHSWTGRIGWRPLLAYLWLLLLLTSASKSTASDALEVSVARDKIYMNEMLELTITGKKALELNFNSLFNLGNLQLPEPDISALFEHFNVVDRQQKYNVQSINGVNNATITWVYSFTPRHTGTIRIPPLTFNGQTSEPIEVQVLDGKREQSDAEPPLAFLEVSVDKSQVYLYEQIRYSMKLYYADHLASGELSTPNPPGTITEALGEQKKTSAYRFNQRYEVVEREYVIFPQQAGTLRIEAQTFTGTLIDRRLGRKQILREVSDALEIDVKPPVSGGYWLPATSLSLFETWDKTPEQVRVGDNLTRTLTIKALGLLGSALPPLAAPVSEGFKVYPDQPATESKPHAAGVEASRVEKQALIAIKPGHWTLPELRIAWFDTLNNQERVALIPARTIEVVAPASASGIVTQTPPALIASDSPAINPPESIDKPSALAPADTAHEANQRLWWLIGFMATGWLVTIGYFLGKRSSPTASSAGPAPVVESPLTALVHAIKQRDPQWLIALKHWAASYHPDRPCESLSDIQNLMADPQLQGLLASYEQSFYSAQKQAVDPAALIKALTQADQRLSTKSATKDDLLALYPLG